MTERDEALVASKTLYEHVADKLLADLAERGLRAGDRLPAERSLAERFGVSRVTMRAALTRLESLGALRPAASRGWFVVAPVGEPEPPRAVLGVQGFADEAAAVGLPTHSKVLSQVVRPATIEEAERLRIAPGADLFELVRLRYLDDLVVLLAHNQLPLAVCPELATTDFTKESLYATLRGATPSVAPQVAEYSVEARVPTADEAELLEIVDGAPVLAATQIAYYGDRRPLEYSLTICRGDRYRFRASITSLPAR